MKTFSTLPNDETLPYLRGVYSSIGFFRNLVLNTNDVTNRDSDV